MLPFKSKSRIKLHRYLILISYTPLGFQSKSMGGLVYLIQGPFQNVVPYLIGVHLYPGYNAVDSIKLAVIRIVVLLLNLKPALIY